jgi:hypothetical protein
MKTSINSILVFFFIGLIVISCEKENAKNKQLNLTGQLISNSTCKNGLKSTSATNITPDSLSCIDYSFDNLSNKLIIKHINAGFNCCPDSLYCNISLKNDTIVIQEFEAAALCDCNCLYDLDIEINGVDSKKYQIKLIEPYLSEQSEIIFEIDLTKNMNGSFCVTRKQYPWGMNSINE